jgi:hypothetical protein
LEKFRTGLANLFLHIGRSIRFTILELPRYILTIPFLKRIFRSTWYRWAYRIAIKPAAFTGVAYLIAWIIDSETRWSYRTLGIMYVSLAVVSNSRVGRDIGEITSERLLRIWDRIGIKSIVILFRWLMERFRRALDAVDRMLYAIDEWLRFRTSDGPVSVIGKTLVSPIWAIVRYIVRFCVTLLIEPQINPIKHFPVVTVSHKILLPFIPALQGAGVLVLKMNEPTALLVAATIIGLIPGAVGFLVWELRENWRLYSANRPKTLIPVPVGPHAETIERLLAWGFHSGTLPKRYAKLRHEFSRAEKTGAWSAVRRHVRTLNNVELSVRRFIERSFIAFFAHSDAWSQTPLHVRRIRASANRVVATLGINGTSEEPIQLTFDACGKHCMTTFAAPRWNDVLDTAQTNVLHQCLAGFHLMAGTDIVRERLESRLPDNISAYRIQDDRVVLWMEPACEQEVVCRLLEPGTGDTGRHTGSEVHSHLVTEIERADIAPTSMTYDDWLDAWNTESPQTPRNDT